MQLSEYFTLAEFTVSQEAARKGISNTPPAFAMANLKFLAKNMDKVRAALGNNPIHVSSAYRSPELNRAIGGAAKSQHVEGLACDFTCSGFGGTWNVCSAIIEAGLKFDQLIHEYDHWVHISFVPSGGRSETLFINRDSGGYRKAHFDGKVPA